MIIPNIMIWMKSCPLSEREKPRSLPFVSSSPTTSLQQQDFRTIAALIMEPLSQLLPNRMFCSFTVRGSSSVHGTSSAASWHSSTVETSIEFSRIPILLKLFLLTPKNLHYRTHENKVKQCN